MPYEFVSAEEFQHYPKDQLPVSAVWAGFTANTTAHGIPHVKNARGQWRRQSKLQFKAIL